LNTGLSATNRNDSWKLTLLSTIHRYPPTIIPRNGEVTVSATAELLNDRGQIIGNSGSITLGRFSFKERGTAVSNRANIRQLVFTVKADDITDQMSLRITASTSPSQNNLVQVLDYTEFVKARPDLVKTISNTTPNLPKDGSYISDKEFFGKGLDNVIIQNDITYIGNEAFANNKLTSIIIPKSVTYIGFSAFAGNQLTSITIPNNTSIRSSAFSSNKIASITIGTNVILDGGAIGNGFEVYYTGNGRKAGTYTYDGKQWRYKP